LFYPHSAASETENPRRNISKAVRRVFWRIVIFYILGILITGMLVPYDDPDLLNGNGTATQSPYVIAIRRAGIHTLPSIINAAIFTSAFSAGNSFLFCSSRILYGLSIRGQAPRIFSYCTKNGLPIVAVLFCVGFFFFFLSFSLLVKFNSPRALRSVLLLPLCFHERVVRCGQSFQVRFYSFFLSFFPGVNGHVAQPLVFFAAGSSTSRPPLASSRGGPSI
jgi:L-asparagine transporter-like permease